MDRHEQVRKSDKYVELNFWRKFVQASIGEQVAVVTFVLAGFTFAIKEYIYLYYLGSINALGINSCYIDVDYVFPIYSIVILAVIVAVISFFNFALYYAGKSKKKYWIILLFATEQLIFMFALSFFQLNIEVDELMNMFILSPDIRGKMNVLFSSLFFASTFWTKLQNIFGHCCMSKLDKVAKRWPVVLRLAI